MSDTAKITSSELLAAFREFAAERGWTLVDYDWKDIEDGEETYTIWLAPKESSDAA